MKRSIVAAAAIAALLAVTACKGHRNEALAAEGAQPPMANPVGPVPGPDRALPLPANPFANDPVAREAGRQLFNRYNCSGCHGTHGGGGMGPSLRDEDWIYGGSDADIFSSISEGRAHGMPAWGTKIPAMQVWQLAAYIKSMRTPDEPEPPTP